jgi:hypothetical protein
MKTKVKIGEELTARMRVLSKTYKISMQAIARKARNSFEKSGRDIEQRATLPTSYGTVLELNDDLKPGEWRYMIDIYCYQNMPDMDKFWAMIEKELEETRAFVDDYKKSMGTFINEDDKEEV